MCCWDQTGQQKAEIPFPGIKTEWLGVQKYLKYKNANFGGGNEESYIFLYSSVLPFLYLIPNDISFPGGSTGKESACNAGDLVSMPGLGRSPGEGKGYPRQYSGLENSVHRATELDTTDQLSLHFIHLLAPLLMHLCTYTGIDGSLLSRTEWIHEILYIHWLISIHLA